MSNTDSNTNDQKSRYDSMTLGELFAELGNQLGTFLENRSKKLELSNLVHSAKEKRFKDIADLYDTPNKPPAIILIPSHFEREFSLSNIGIEADMIKASSGVPQLRVIDPSKTREIPYTFESDGIKVDCSILVEEEILDEVTIYWLTVKTTEDNVTYYISFAAAKKVEVPVESAESVESTKA